MTSDQRSVTEATDSVFAERQLSTCPCWNDFNLFNPFSLVLKEPKKLSWTYSHVSAGDGYCARWETRSLSGLQKLSGTGLSSPQTNTLLICTIIFWNDKHHIWEWGHILNVLKNSLSLSMDYWTHFFQNKVLWSRSRRAGLGHSVRWWWVCNVSCHSVSVQAAGWSCLFAFVWEERPRNDINRYVWLLSHTLWFWVYSVGSVAVKDQHHIHLGQCCCLTLLFGISWRYNLGLCGCNHSFETGMLEKKHGCLNSDDLDIIPVCTRLNAWWTEKIRHFRGKPL